MRTDLRSIYLKQELLAINISQELISSRYTPLEEVHYDMKPTTPFVTAILASTPIVSAGPAAYGICQTGCAAVVTACYAAAGFTWGATAGISAPATIVACNSAFGTCQAACWVAAIAPTP
ncbi:hypothetical protein F5B21DRAFT_499555 [Xylaria acuta]|nr:hypothetical protein F5B21DRAFT_499555 [Xylaria acuta]